MLLKLFFKKIEQKLYAKFCAVKINTAAIRKLCKNRLKTDSELLEINGDDNGTDERARVWAAFGAMLKSDVALLTARERSFTFSAEEVKSGIRWANLLIEHLEKSYQDHQKRRLGESLSDKVAAAREAQKAKIANRPSSLG